MSKLVRSWWLLVIPAGVALGAITTYVATFHHLPATENPGAWGTFGDYFGGLLNPLISALTLFVAISVWQLQKQELAETRKAMEEQAKTAEQQRQEQRFFDLLNVYFRTVESISYLHSPVGNLVDPPERFEGKAAMAAWLGAGELRKLAENRETSIPGQTGDLQDLGHPQHQFWLAWTEKQPKRYFDSYFQVIRHLLSEAPELLKPQDRRYISLFRAQLSETELILLAYHLLLDEHARKNLAASVSKYNLLEHLLPGDLRTELLNFFGPDLISSALPADRPSSLSPTPTEKNP